MTEHPSFAEARKVLADNNMAYYRHPSLGGLTDGEREQFLDGYARICEFLSNKSRFEGVLNTLSQALWLHYIRDPSESNKFTRALSMVAQKNGFSVGFRDDHLDTSKPMKFKLIGGDSQIGYLMRNKLFWKDSMDAYHGEHSHSLQWLAIAAAKIETPIPVDRLYQYSVNFKMRDLGPKGGDVMAWQWVADCFPSSIKSDTILKHGHNLTTNTYRSPQMITEYLLHPGKFRKNHFVSMYLAKRYAKRGWITVDERRITGKINGQANAKARSRIADWNESPAHLRKLPDDVRHKPEKRDLTPRLSRKTQVDPRVGPDATKAVRGRASVKFHGITGDLVMD